MSNSNEFAKRQIYIGKYIYYAFLKQSIPSVWYAIIFNMIEYFPFHLLCIYVYGLYVNLLYSWSIVQFVPAGRQPTNKLQSVFFDVPKLIFNRFPPNQDIEFWFFAKCCGMSAVFLHIFFVIVSYIVISYGHDL